MCGITGTYGTKNASKYILNSLKRLEYRGYDSAGIATLHNSKINIKKDTGEIDKINQELNFQEMEGDIGIGHCLHPETLVCTANGALTKISELDNQEVLSLNFGDGSVKNGRKQKLTKHKSPDYLFRISTPFSNFKATGQHRVFVTEGSGVREKKVKNLTGDELIAVPRRIPHSPKSTIQFQEVPVERHYSLNPNLRKKIREERESNDDTRKDIERKTGIASRYLGRIERGERNSIEGKRLEKLENIYPDLDIRNKSEITYLNPVHFPSKPGPNLLQIIGYHIGDGTFHSNRCIRFKDERKEILEEYSDLFSDVFNLSGKIYDREGHFVLDINSKFLVDWFEKNIPSLFKKTGNEEIPEFVFKAPKKQISSLIKGIFDAEGGVASKSRQVYIAMTNKDLIKKIQFLLLKFGILSTFLTEKREKWSNVYRLQINDEKSLKRFKKSVGFTADDKKSKLNSLLNKTKNRNYRYTSFPYKKSNIRNYLKDTNVSNYGSGDSFCSDVVLEEIVEQLEDDYTEIKNYIEKYLNSDIVWARFDIEKTESDVEYVYDLTVEQEHNFIGDLAVQHNSRWATHGDVSRENAHPHSSCDGRFAIVHNGIIENWEELKGGLSGHEFSSETDSEVIAHFVEEKVDDLGVEGAVREFLDRAEGSFAVVLLDAEVEKMYAFKRGSPLALGVGGGETFLGSDLYAFSTRCDEAIFFKDDEYAIIEGDNFVFKDSNGKVLDKEPREFEWEQEPSKKGEFDHYMRKEVGEIPTSIKRLDRSLETTQSKTLEKLADEIQNHERILFTASGTSYHASLLGVFFLNRAGVDAQTLIASEFENYERVDEDTLVIPISQSGETKDVLEAIKFAKERDAKIASIINVPHSTIEREANISLKVKAGQEICVAATKTFTNQLYLLLKLAKKLGYKTHTDILPEEIKKVIKTNEPKIKKLAEELAQKDDIYIIGRGITYPIAREIALKMKEIAYIHAEGMMGGELKHGTLALIEEGTPVVSLIPEEDSEIESNVKEVEARGAKSIKISPFQGSFEIPHSNSRFAFYSTILGFLLAYWIAREKDLPIDKPRNLAKSVTVK